MKTWPVGQVIRTTNEHPFYVAGKGWTPTEQLQPCYEILGLNDETTTVEKIVVTTSEEYVYNFRVERG